MRHIELMCKVILATGSIVGYAYAMEFFIAWYGGNPYELFAFKILQTFPVGITLLSTGKPHHYDHVGRHIGNAVPVDLARIIAKSIRQHLDSLVS